ncbi:MAG: hypothetical protein KJO95_08200, partial [Gammaproteobacteria bacterium]|nr:hypothetical protein [Gammaproteobacteria bacterium]
MTKTPDRRPGIQYEETSILFEDQGGIEQTIYVRSTGSDTTGDGKTTGTAFRTVRHALTTIPYVLYG